MLFRSSLSSSAPLYAQAQNDVAASLSEARGFPIESRDVYQNIGRKDSAARRLVDLATLEFGLGDYEPARKNFEEAKNIFHDLGHGVEEALQYIHLAKISEEPTILW